MVGEPGRSDRTSIEALFAAGYTAGCANQSRIIGAGDRSQLFRYYCPDAVTDRAQASVIVLKAKYRHDYTPPPATGLFADVPTNVWYAPWVEQMYRDGITTGCGINPLRFCPTSPVTRAQLAVFLVRAEGWSLVTPTGARFSDIPASHWAAAYIETLDVHGAATRCTGNNFCPDAGATRGQLAIFTAKAEALVP
jgi:S-layer homology domain